MTGSQGTRLQIGGKGGVASRRLHAHTQSIARTTAGNSRSQPAGTAFIVPLAPCIKTTVALVFDRVHRMVTSPINRA